MVNDLSNVIASFFMTALKSEITLINDFISRPGWNGRNAERFLQELGIWRLSSLPRYPSSLAQLNLLRFFKNYKALNVFQIFNITNLHEQRIEPRYKCMLMEQFTIALER